jgi:hypothetical protein
MRRRLGVCLLAFVAMTGVGGAQPAPAGRIKLATGAASVVRAGAVMAATPGMAVGEADVLRTGADGRLSVMLKDESRLSLGPNSELALTRFAYSPQDQQLGLGVRLARGVLSYISGLIARIAPEAVQLQTPTSIIGIRGTHVLVKAEAP